MSNFSLAQDSWSYADALGYLEALGERRIRPGLERMRAACRILGSPERSVPAVHIAGTNGKGSTAACLTQQLMQGGYRVGLYTSPHLLTPRERIQINRQLISADDFASCLSEVATCCGELLCSYFETFTLASFLYFARNAVDIAIYETGLGGRLDATNVLANPELVILTSISRDHAQWLGDDLRVIAREKCGIVKPQVPVVSAPQVSCVRDEIVAVCAHAGVPLVQASPSSVKVRGLAGAHQEINIGVSAQAGALLRSRGWSCVDPGEVAAVSWAGRSEMLGPILFDGAHNCAAAGALLHQIREQELHPGCCGIALCDDKPIEEMLRIFSAISDRLVALETGHSRHLSAEALCRRAAACDVAMIPQSLDHFVTDALASNQPSVATGSLMLYAPLRAALKQLYISLD